MTELNLNEIKRDLDAVPPPPWRWIGREETGPLLVTDHSGQLYLLGPAHPVDEHGRQLTDDEDVPIYADLMFRDERDGEDRYPVMRRAAEMIVPRTSYDPATYRDIDNPVARWIVRSAEHATALVAEVERQNGALSIAQGMLGASRRQVEEATDSVVSLSARVDVLTARCAQMEADHAETVAELEKLRAADQRARELHSERQLREYDDVTGYQTGEWLPSICGGCTNPDLIEALDAGELIEPTEAAPWPCPTIRALDGGAS